MTSRRQWLTAIEQADIVEPKKTALENIVPFGILSINPPREIKDQLVKDAFKKLEVTNTRLVLLQLINAPCGPGMYRRVHITECPLVSRQLTVRVHVPLTQQKNQL